MAENETNPIEQNEALSRLATFASFFNTTNGRKILAYLQESLDGNTFRRDPYDSAYAAGRRSVYLNIMQAVGQGITILESPEPAKVQQPRAELPATIEEL